MTTLTRILCYGDSNTWGYDGTTADRFGPDVRWPARLDRALGDDVDVIAEGLSGRTTLLDDPYEPGRNGRTYLMPCLRSHVPLDLVVLMLGTNDTKSRFRVSSGDITRGCGILIDDIRMIVAHALPVLLVAPAPLGDETGMPDMFDAVSVATSRELSTLYAGLAEEKHVHYFDAGTVTGHLNHTDGIHLNAENHYDLADALTHVITRIIR